MLLYLINPDNPLVSLGKSKLSRWNRYTVWKPLGLLVVAGLTPKEWNIKVFDENVQKQDYSLLPVPDLVGITSFTSQADRAYAIAHEFKQRGVPVVMGGIHATMCPDEAGQRVTSVVTGEAESVWKDVLDDWGKGRLKPVYAGTHEPLNNTPIARHDLIPTGYRFGSIQTTRGCPLSCSFCSVTTFNGSHYRHRPIAQVIEEYRTILEKLVLMVDDNFIGTRKDHIDHTKELLRAIIASGIRKQWIAQVTINFGDDPELLALASKAGCVGVFIGLETTSAEGLEEIHKRFNIRKIDDIRNAIGRIHRNGISVVGSFIMGLDIDKKDVGREIAAAAQRYSLDALNVMFLTPLPGTDLWDDMEAKGRIILNATPQDWRYFTLTFPVARYNHLTWSDMIAEKDACYSAFYTYPKILQRVYNGIRQRRNPFAILFSNLVYRINTLRLDRKVYRNFDTSPGEVPLCQWARKKSGNRVLPMAFSHPVRKPKPANAMVFSMD
jgi:radical SAM superfamily enzyme YgiQ (UPF0313 family)